MIRLIFGGKKNEKWLDEASAEYLKRLRKPFDAKIEIMDDEKLAKLLEKWPFSPATDFVILADERGEILSSPEFAAKLQSAQNTSKQITIVIGGAYGFTPEARKKADFLWSFSKLVFPHQLARLIAVEQLYRAYSIATGGKYHHA